MKKIHFSIDDVFESLIEITDKKISLKKHFFYKELYKLWKKYGIRTGLHLFYEKKINGKLRTLKEVRSLKNELKENWLFFNIHALNNNVPPYKQSPNDQKKTFNKIFKEIERFAGKKYLTKYVRLHHYSESFELNNYFKKKKIIALFSTDRSVGSHRMPKKNSQELINLGETKYKSLEFIKTDFRLEWIENYNKKTITKKFKNCFDKKNRLIIYSHEYDFKRKKLRVALNKSMKILFQNFKVKVLKP